MEYIFLLFVFFMSIRYKIILFKSMWKRDILVGVSRGWGLSHGGGVHHRGGAYRNLIILPKMCNVMDYITNYNLYHVIIWNQ